MELIQIIFDILIYGGASLFVVILISFWISKARNNDLTRTSYSFPTLTTSSQIGTLKLDSVKLNQQPANQQEQSRLRELSTNTQPKIFPIDRQSQRELKIIRKPTFHASTQTSEEFNVYQQKNNLRYTVVNEQMKNAKSRAFNFYL